MRLGALPIMAAACALAAGWACLSAGCAKFRLPSQREMERVFVSQSTTRFVEPKAPPAVPEVAVSEMSSWRELCNQCHVGPHYSSHTILNWGHRDSCIASMACVACHHEQLHRTDVRGDKAKCMECHLTRNEPVKCETCHVKGCATEHARHTPEFLGQHGKHTDWVGLKCTVCHGSERWCLNCHGLPMPHPADIIKIHPSLVQGQPEVCANCHGAHSCIRCHQALGVRPK